MKKSRVIIVSKTRMRNGVCIGGILKNGRFVRLLKSDGYNQDFSTDLNIGDVCTIDFLDREDLVPPHVEDILVSKIVKNGSVSLLEVVEIINPFLNAWIYHIDELFDKKLSWTDRGSGFIDERNIPNNSVGFWVTNQDLTKMEYSNGKVKYHYENNSKGQRLIPFVGYQDPIDIIPAGTLMRVSLARWWLRPNDKEEKCFLQLSGWYI